MIPRAKLVAASLCLLVPFACADAGERVGFDELDEIGEGEGPGGEAGASPPTSGFITDAGVPEAGDAAFEACAATVVEATRERLPVDIIWIVDNSASMQPAVAEVQAGLNAFAAMIGLKLIDYKVIMLSKRGTAPTAGRYQVCIPPPLGGADCGNSAKFFHASLDVKSTQPLEQFLGTLDQTSGYTPGDSYGCEPWAQELRPNATKSIVIVTDDDSRFSATRFESFPGGKNPKNNRMLPPGILHPSRGDQFKDYVFSGIYGWGSATDPTEICTYPDGTEPSSPGGVYTQLVTKTGGARAKICDGSAAWAPFFDDVAKAVVATSKITCELAIPTPDAGVLDPNAVNVQASDGASPPVVVPRVPDEAACAGAAGWYYDDAAAPTKVRLCPASCDAAQPKGGADAPKLEVLFGCASIVR